MSVTSSPAPTPSVASAVCRPAVHELSASAPGASSDAANSVSKRLVFGPVVIQSERSVSTTSRISSSPMTGGAKGRNSVRRAGARVSDTGAPRPFRRWRMWGRRPRRPCPRTRAGAASGSRGWRAHARGPGAVVRASATARTPARGAKWRRSARRASRWPGSRGGARDHALPPVRPLRCAR